jgi:dipeptidyl aminopeptidase/acylaminoacyl peptidase
MIGTPVDNRLGYEKWNPMNHVAEWSTPTLVIHSGKDFRLIEGAGIGKRPFLLSV